MKLKNHIYTCWLIQGTSKQYTSGVDRFFRGTNFGHSSPLLSYLFIAISGIFEGFPVHPRMPLVQKLAVMAFQTFSVFPEIKTVNLKAPLH